MKLGELLRNLSRHAHLGPLAEYQDAISEWYEWAQKNDPDHGDLVILNPELITDNEATGDTSDFDEATAIAVLLANGVAFVNSRKYLCVDNRTPRPETIVVFLTCSDLFQPGLADKLRISYYDIKPLYLSYKQYGYLGIVQWIIVTKKLLPNNRGERELKKAGLWTSEVEAIYCGQYK